METGDQLLIQGLTQLIQLSNNTMDRENPKSIIIKFVLMHFESQGWAAAWRRVFIDQPIDLETQISIWSTAEKQAQFGLITKNWKNADWMRLLYLLKPVFVYQNSSQTKIGLRQQGPKLEEYHNVVLSLKDLNISSEHMPQLYCLTFFSQNQIAGILRNEDNLKKLNMDWRFAQESLIPVLQKFKTSRATPLAENTSAIEFFRHLGISEDGGERISNFLTQFCTEQKRESAIYSSEKKANIQNEVERLYTTFESLKENAKTTALESSILLNDKIADPRQAGLEKAILLKLRQNLKSKIEYLEKNQLTPVEKNLRLAQEIQRLHEEREKLKPKVDARKLYRMEDIDRKRCLESSISPKASLQQNEAYVKELSSYIKLLQEMQV